MSDFVEGPTGYSMLKSSNELFRDLRVNDHGRKVFPRETYTITLELLSPSESRF